MPALSKVQQRLMGMAYAYKKGELDSKDASQEVKDLADSMTLKQLKKFAATKHEGLPERVPENIQAGQINGMGPIELPADGLLGSGDVPAGKGDAEEEYKKKKKKMANFEEFINGLNTQPESGVNETRFYAFHKNQKYEIEADSLWAAKQKAITDLKVKKKDVGLLAVVNADLHDDFSKGKKGQFQFESDQVDEVYTGTASDFKYEFQNQFEDVTGFSDKAIKGIRKKGKNDYEVRTSTYAGKEYMEAVGKQMGLEIKKFEKHSNMCITVYESVQVAEARAEKYDNIDIQNAWTETFGKGADIMFEFPDVIDDVLKDYRDKATIKDLYVIWDNRYGMEPPKEFLDVLGESVISEIRMSSWGDLEYTEEDIEQTWGWCGTLSDELGEDKAMFLTHQGIHELQKRHMGLTVWEALAVLNSKAGRHAAEAFLGGEADASDTTSALIWYFGSKRKVQQAAKEEAELQFPSK
jgi:hypothetical protein